MVTFHCRWKMTCYIYEQQPREEMPVSFKPLRLFFLLCYFLLNHLVVGFILSKKPGCQCVLRLSVAFSISLQQPHMHWRWLPSPKLKQTECYIWLLDCSHYFRHKVLQHLWHCWTGRLLWREVEIKVSVVYYALGLDLYRTIDQEHLEMTIYI